MIRLGRGRDHRKIAEIVNGPDVTAESIVTTIAEEGVTALSDLEGRPITLAAAPDCKGRNDCEKGLREVYGIDLTLEPLGYASPETFQAGVML